MSDALSGGRDEREDAALDAKVRAVLAARAAGAEAASLGAEAAAARLERRLGSRTAAAGSLRLAGLLAGVVAALAVPFIAGQLDRDPYVPTGGTVTVAFTRPAALLTAFGSVWVAGPETAELGRIDPATGALVRLTLDAPVCGALQEDGTAIWMVHCGGVPFATRLDPAGGETMRLSGVASRNLGIGEEVIAIPGEDGRSVIGLDGETFEERWRVDVDGEVRTFASSAGTIWAIEEATGRVHRLDAASGRVVATIAVAAMSSNGAGLRTAAASGETLWLVHEGDLRVYRIDAASGRASQPIDAGLEPIQGPAVRPDHWIVVVDGTPWVRINGETIGRLDPATGRLVAREPAGVGGGAFAVTSGSRWSASFGSNAVLGERR